MCLLGKIQVLGEHPSIVSDNAVGHEFDINVSTIYIK